MPCCNNMLRNEPMNIPTLAQWQRGLKIAEQIAALEQELARILGNHPVSPTQVAKATSAPGKRKKGKMSAEGRARIVAAQKARWAKIKAGKAPVASKAPAKAKAEAPVKKRRKMSPEVKAKLAAAMRARWAAAKAGKGPAPTAKKKK